MKTTLKQLPGLLPFFALLIASGAYAAEASKPNIIFVLSDDQRWDVLGAAGNPHIQTPNMDRLAREGIHFPQATVTNPQCMCSRSALLTGLTTHTNGRYSNQTARKDITNPHGFDQYDCLPEVLDKAGYLTAMVGKWHIETDPWNMGFEKIGAWFPPGSGAYKNAALAQGKSRERTKSKGFIQERFGDSAVQIINEHADSKSSQPLFLWFATTAPHGPFGPNPDGANAPYEGKSLEQLLPPTFKGNTKGKTAKWIKYYASTTAVDIELGRIMTALEDNRMTSNTVVVFMGDNGFMMGSRDRQGKTVPYEDSIRVPMIVWGPGVIKGNGTSQASLSSLDLSPTLVKLAGGAVPDSWQGRDVTQTLTDTKAHGTTWSISESVDYNNWKFPKNAYRTVRTPENKLIVWEESTGKAPEFYDLVKDPHEENNLYTDPALQPRVKELTHVLKTWMKDTDDNWKMRGELVVKGGPDHGGKIEGADKKKSAKNGRNG